MSEQFKATRRHYSQDLKQRVIYQHVKFGLMTVQIAENLDISIRVVQRTLKIWQEIGDVVKDPTTYAKRGKASLLDSGSVEACTIATYRIGNVY
jgi:transposase